ncbi:MAG: hypothetical protein RL297_1634 [Pseudomonadota bacterium]|jgi:D-alanyl-D-alanine dipeptidase
MPHPLISICPESHGVVLDLIYASPNNIVGRPIYARQICLLHRDAELRLRRAVELAAAAGYRLKIYDAFRPQEAQRMLWETAPDKAYVADPVLGSDHTRGIAIDLTLADANGHEVDMGTAFDDMTALSHHFCDQVSPEAQANRMLLLHVMQEAGFEHMANEWWHYSLPQREDYELIPSTHLGSLDPMLTG